LVSIAPLLELLEGAFLLVVGDFFEGSEDRGVLSGKKKTDLLPGIYSPIESAPSLNFLKPTNGQIHRAINIVLKNLSEILYLDTPSFELIHKLE